MKNTILALLAICSISLFSCETLVNDVDPDRLPRSDSKLVVHGYLSPQDTTISINVYYSSQLIGGNNSPYWLNGSPISLNDAVVTLSNQGKRVTLPFDSKTGTYSIKATTMPILEGQTYELKVERGGQTAEAQCTVPKAVAIQEIKQDSVDSKMMDPSNPNYVPPKEYLYRIVWRDIAGQENYYRVGGYVFQNQTVQTNPNMVTVIPSIQDLNFGENNRLGAFSTDASADGLEMISSTARTRLYNYPGSTLVFKVKYVELTLLNCEKTYYDYHRAVQAFDRNNPFAEPSLIPSNIKNGLGCFAAFNRSSFVLK
ncbi:hypothetical protein DR864_19020 [Runella rosea]|uniref:DUF4249 domain-containing protein n=1 Tax=Runella rosea TaxID=2259595 RepID=A0A344TM07_9BACT|nr:DUF4249 domain-containing protein [Runella rosea]AXE19678.1 hypothetical protein DR864_19020 [Runella rosea]